MKQKDFLLLLVPASLITLAWVIFNIYHHSVSSTISDPLNIQIIPIDGDFKMSEINKIKNRQKVDPIYTLSQSIPDSTPEEASPSSQLETFNEGPAELEVSQ